MTNEILLLIGPNLNLLGTREPATYGTQSLQEHFDVASAAAASSGLSLKHLQSNDEATLINAVHEASENVGIIINPAAFTHYSWALADALAAYKKPVIEVHLSNPEKREAWRRTSVVSPVATGTISGFGSDGYRLAVRALAGHLRKTTN